MHIRVICRIRSMLLLWHEAVRAQPQPGLAVV